MAEALDRLVAMAVVQYLQEQAAELPEQVDPSFCYVPTVDMATEKRVRVLTAPRDRSRTRLNRSHTATREHLVQLAILQKLTRGPGKGEFNISDERVDQLVDLIASIDDLLMGEAMVGAQWMSSATDPLYDPAILRKGFFSECSRSLIAWSHSVKSKGQRSHEEQFKSY